MCQEPKVREELEEFWAQRGSRSDRSTVVGKEVEELGWYFVTWGRQGSASSEDQEKRRRKGVGGSKAEMLQAPTEHLWAMEGGEARPWLQSRPTL